MPKRLNLVVHIATTGLIKKVKTPQIYMKFAVLMSADRYTGPSTTRVTICMNVDPVIAKTNVTKLA